MNANMLEVISIVIKVLLVALGAVTANDTATLHLSQEDLGMLVSGLGTAALAVKGLQAKVKSNESKQIKPQEPQKGGQ